MKRRRTLLLIFLTTSLCLESKARFHKYRHFSFLCTSLWEFERPAMAVNSLTCALLKTNNNSFFLIIIQEGACFLRGEELVANQFQVDTLERKFSKDKLKAVTLIIQLCSRR